MRTWHTTCLTGLSLALIALTVPARAQQVTVRTPFHSASGSFFENNSISWSGQLNFLDNSPNHAYQGQGITFSYGGGALTKPQFGSPDLSAGLTTGFAILGKSGQFTINMNFSQGDRQSLITQTPSVTLMNGQTGYFSDTSQTPFVISVVPVVGGFPNAPTPQQLQQISSLEPDDRADGGGAAPQAQQPLPNHNNIAPRQNARLQPDPLPDAAQAAGQRLDAAQESSAGRPAVSVAEAKRLHEQELAKGNGTMEAVMERARALEEDGKPNLAKIYYQQVAKHATGNLQQQARAKLDELRVTGK